MNTEAIGRMMEARKYQKLAIKALFPEEKQEHIDNIERELKALLTESVMENMMKFMSAASTMNAADDRKDTREQPEDETGEEKKTAQRREGKEKNGTRSTGVKKERVHKVTID